MTLQKLLVTSLLLLQVAVMQAAEKPKISLDEFFNAVEIESVKLSPDGKAVIIGTSRADWDQSILRHELCLYRHSTGGNGSLSPFAPVGHYSPPDGAQDGKGLPLLPEP